jgi:hypothetical protein
VDIVNIGMELVRSIAHTLAGQVILLAIIFLVFGLGFWIGSIFIHGKNNPDLSVAALPPTP